ncbi:cell division protein ZapA [uncultured Methylobacterium sp.]|uniref:cell division protein ZapA n=1 Tax=uncultured Methylobacterium sp. TaxID=157278 RepID=UPI0035C97CFA
MPQISVTIDGKSYRMACGEGEEAHLTALAAGLGARVVEMRAAFGEIGDMRLQVMAALTIADEVSELKRQLSLAEDETARLRSASEAAAEERTRQAGRVADGVAKAAARIERMARALDGPGGRDTPKLAESGLAHRR